MYAIQWSHGQIFDFNKTQVQTHRARLRKIGIDIAQKCDVSKFSVVMSQNPRQIVKTDCVIPDWYQKPPIFRIAA